jgi:hypothetical protein
MIKFEKTPDHQESGKRFLLRFDALALVFHYVLAYYSRGECTKVLHKTPFF